jgi:pimeloyl-ACP methyl ester carboxylesterase
MTLRASRWWLVVPGLMLLWLMLDRPHPRAAHQAEWLDAGGVSVRAVRAGRGDTTILLLHGYGESLTTWRAIFDRLAERRRVVAIDLPGFGVSGKPDTVYSLPALADRLSHFIDAWTTGPLVVVGHSMGGELAAALALARPDRVSRLVLIAPAGFRVGLGGLMETMSTGKATAIGKYLSFRSFVTPIHDPGWLAEPDSFAAYDLTGDSAYSRVATRVLEEFDFAGLRDRFAGIRQPTLLIWGGLDPVIPPAASDSVAHLIPCVRTVLVPTAFHRPQAEVPDTVVFELERFLAKSDCGRVVTPFP